MKNRDNHSYSLKLLNSLSAFQFLLFGAFVSAWDVQCCLTTDAPVSYACSKTVCLHICITLQSAVQASVGIRSSKTV